MPRKYELYGRLLQVMLLKSQVYEQKDGGAAILACFRQAVVRLDENR